MIKKRAKKSKQTKSGANCGGNYKAWERKAKGLCESTHASIFERALGLELGLERERELKLELERPGHVLRAYPPPPAPRPPQQLAKVSENEGKKADLGLRFGATDGPPSGL